MTAHLGGAQDVEEGTLGEGAAAGDLDLVERVEDAVRLQDPLPLAHVPTVRPPNRPKQGQKIVSRGIRANNWVGWLIGDSLGEEGDELVAVGVEGVLHAFADARDAVKLRGGHGWLLCC